MSRPLSLTVKALLLASGKLLTAISTLLATATLTRLLPVEEYGTHRQVLLVFAMVSPVLMMGVPKALYYFLPGETARPRGVLLDNLAVLTLGGVLFGLGIALGLGDLVADRFDNPAVSPLLWLLIPYALFFFPQQAISACLMAVDKVRKLVLYNVASRLLLVLTVIAAALISPTARATVTANALWAAVVGIPAIVLMLRAVGPGGRPSQEGMATQLRFGIPLGLASLLGVLSLQFDKFIVSSMCSTEDFAIYVTGAMEVPLIDIVTGAITAVVIPQLTVFYKTDRLDQIVSLWQRAMNKALLILTPVMFVVLLLGDELMTVVFSARYTDSSVPLRIYALMLPLRSAVYGSVLMATDNTRYVTLSALVGLVVNVALSWLMVWMFGANGAAWATCIAVYAVAGTLLFPMARVLKTTPRALVDWRHVGTSLLAAGLPAAPVFAVGYALDAPDLVRLVVMGGLYGLGVVLVYRQTGLATPRQLLDFLRRRGRQAPPPDAGSP